MKINGVEVFKIGKNAMKALKRHRFQLFGLLMGKISKMSMNDMKNATAVEEPEAKGSAVAEAIRARFNLNG